MSLAVIGAGLGRTGTSSLRDALNHLGYPCYHMSELAFNPARRSDLAFWEDIQSGAPSTPAGWDAVFGGFRAALDYPACIYWRELMAVYPDAKVVLSQHPGGSDAWYESTLGTLHKGTGPQGASDFGKRFDAMMDRLVWNGFFQGKFEDRATAVAIYEAHAQEVRDTVPADRLVEWTADEGWAPICEALGEPVPDIAFFKRNTRAEMARRVALLERTKSFGLDGSKPRTGTSD